MPVSNPFVEPGRWFRACLHAHSTNSDGLMPPDSLVRHYRTAGFDILAVLLGNSIVAVHSIRK
jgi:hypothetical protein